MKKVAVVGFGFMGMTHALNILKSGKLELRAIVEKNPRSVKENLKRSLGNIATGEVPDVEIRKLPVYSSLDECLDREDVDALHICVHTQLHHEMARLALDRGKHVLIEKPFTLNVADGRELIRMARRNRLVLMVAHVVRFVPAYRKLKEWVDSGTFGRLQFLHLSRAAGIPAWGQWKKNRAVRASSGGALFDMQIHDVDFMLSTMGEPARVDPFVLPGAMSRNDYLSARWHFSEPSRMGVIEGGYIFHARLPFESRFVARFEEASVFYSTLAPGVVSLAGDDSLERVVVGDPAEGYLEEILYFADCLEENRWPERCSPESSLRAVELCYRHIQNEGT